MLTENTDNSFDEPLKGLLPGNSTQLVLKFEDYSHSFYVKNGYYSKHLLLHCN